MCIIRSPPAAYSITKHTWLWKFRIYEIWRPKLPSNLCLEAREEIDEEGVSHRVCHFEDPLLSQQGLHLVPGNNVALLQGLDSKVFPSVLVPAQGELKLRFENKLESIVPAIYCPPCQNDLAKVASAKNSNEVEAVEPHPGIWPDRKGRPVGLAWWVPRSRRLVVFQG